MSARGMIDYGHDTQGITFVAREFFVSYFASALGRKNSLFTGESKHPFCNIVYSLRFWKDDLNCFCEIRSFWHSFFPGQKSVWA